MPTDHLKQLRKSLLPYGLKLLESEWHGWHAQYRFRCRKGHELGRSGSHLYYHLVACPACRNDEALRRLDMLARAAGGRCISDCYTGRGKRYQFICRAGHVFEKLVDSLEKGSWCVVCARTEHSRRMADPQGMKRIRAAARAQGGKCLTASYTKLGDRYRFRCAAGHEWETVGLEVIRGAWCRICSNLKKVQGYRLQDGLARLQRCAEKHGGICLSTAYEGSKAHYRFRCEAGHQFDMLGARIFRGSWCTECQHEAKRYGMSLMRKLAEAHGGRCLSGTYRNAATRLEWECARGHRWWAYPGAIVRGHWCAACAHDAGKLGIDLMQAIAKERGGDCVSKTYVNSSTRLEWECARGHRWFATPNTIRRGHWCARCYFISITTTDDTRRKQRHEAARK
ncbi:hypothetical protein [Burkholderia cepacia]|uniref:hypothetical protein n=1 Tax=Burkholderia cepacia TaxID=292 RepID=UPI001CF256E3|nr:hypothetical protein [Burkholderia cepacia]MCA8031014.1 hypothetical protein [Burkholderia cepacia]